MSTVKISQLSQINRLDANTANSLFMGVDLPSGVTGKFTAHVLAQGLYSHEVLNVGTNPVVLPNVAGQFSGLSDNYVQINHQNLNGNGSGDIVITANSGDDSNYYIDMGINGNTYNYDGYTYAKPLDGYLVVQGKTENDPGGNLVIGTTTVGKDIRFVNGSIDESQIVMDFVYEEGFHFRHNPIFFADGSSQNTASKPADYSVASFGLANTVNSYAYAANTFLQANDATTLAVAISTGQANVGSALAAAKVYTDAANTWLRANDASTLAAANFHSDTALGNQTANLYSYSGTAFAQANAANNLATSSFAQANTTATALTVTDSVAQGAFTRATNANTMVFAAYNKANNALANSSGIFAGNLTITGNTQVAALNTANFSVQGTANVSGTLNVVGVISGNAQVVLSNTNFLATESAVTISASPTIATPANDGYMIHISGKNGIPSRIVTDSYGTGSYSVYASRTARGNVAYPSAVQSGDIIGRFSAGGYGTTKFQPFGTGRIDFIAAENFTDTNTGSQITFWNCPVGSNTLTNILTLNGDSAVFTGVVNPQKGFIYTPRIPSGNQTTIAIDYATDAIVKANCAGDVTITHANFTAGKVVELWLVNTAGTNHTVTHGVSALNSTTNSTTFTIPSTSSAYMRFFSIDGDLANTFVTVTHA